MANEKILNTRIRLKYDEYATWYEKNPELLSGEIAIAYLANSNTTTEPNNGTHAVMFKVGPGKFNSLPWASALAADVYAWAKAENVVLSGKTIQFKNGDTVVKSIPLNYITESEANSLIATALASYSTTEQMNAAITVETNRADAAEKALGQRIDAIVTGDNSVAKQIESAIAGLDATQSQAAGADGLALSITEVDGKITAISGSIAANTYDAYGAAAAAQSAAETTAATALSTARTEISAEIDADVKALADGAVATNATNITNIVNGTTPVAKAADADKLGGVVAANYATKAYADQAEADALSEAKKYADEVKKAILTGDSTTELKEAYDTLVEIQTWIEGAGVNATELTEAIATEAKTRGEEDTKLQNQINALGITDGKVATAATADVANSLSESAKNEVKAVKVDNATHTDAATKVDNALTIKTENGTEVVYDGSAVKSVDLTGLATKAYADQAEADAKSYADGLAGNYATAAQGAKADSAVQSVKVLGETLTDGGELTVDEAKTALGLKSAAYTEASAYATAAQGAKADSALQSISAGTGLKVSVKADNSQTIDIDESIVFVFNCGSATELID